MPKRRTRNRIFYTLPSLSTERPDLILYKEVLDNVLKYTQRNRIFISLEDGCKLKEIEELTIRNLEKIRYTRTVR